MIPVPVLFPGGVKATPQQNNGGSSSNSASPSINNITESSNDLKNYSLDDLTELLNNYSESMTKAQHNENEYWFNKTNEYNTQMSNTQYQRMVKDLEAAGLNKLLAYNNSPNNVISAQMPNSARGQDLNGLLGSMVSSINTSLTSTKNTYIRGIFSIIGDIIQGLTKGFTSIFLPK